MIKAWQARGAELGEGEVAEEDREQGDHAHQVEKFAERAGELCGPRTALRSDLVDLVDLMPSLLAYLEVEPPGAMQGRVIDFRSANPRELPRPLVSEVLWPRSQLAVRTPEYTAILSGLELEEGVVFEHARGEAREVTASPGGARFLKEAREVAARHVREGARLRRELELEPELTSDGSFDPDQLEQLRLLGYLE